MIFYSDIVKDQYGEPVNGLQVTVLAETTNDKAALYDGFGNEAANPTATDEHGVFAFYAPAGVYRLEFRTSSSQPAREVQTIRLDQASYASYEYVGTGDPNIDTPGLNAVLDLIKASPPASALIKIKPPFAFNTPGATTAFSMTGLPPTTFDWGGAIVDHYWDVTTPETSIGSWIDGDNTDNIKHVNFEYRLNPRPNFEGYITSVDRPNGKARIKAKQGLRPNFPTMDYIRAIEPSGRWADRQYEGSGNASGQAYPITQISGDIYELGPMPDVNKNVTAVVSYNPLTVSVPSHNFQSDENGDSEVMVVASAFVGGLVSGQSQLNGLTFGIEVVNSSTIILLSGGDYIDATGWTAITGMGVLTLPAMPAWMTVGLEVWGAARKRANPVIDPTNASNWTIKGRFRSAVSVCVKGRYWENPHVELLIRGAGIVGCNAGGFIPAEVRGTITGWMEVFGAGDDAFNVASPFWGKRITAAAGSTITLSTGLFKPREQDVIEFESPANVVSTRKIIAVDDTVAGFYTVTLDSAIPVGFDNATWITRNVSATPRIRFTRFHQTGGGRSFLGQSGDWQIGEGYFRNLRGSAVRAHYPNSQHHYDSGAGTGGGSFGSLTIINCGYDYSNFAAAILQHWKINATAPSTTRAYRYPATVIDGYDYAAVNAAGRDVFIESLSLRNPGTLRSTTRQTMNGQDVMGNYDLNASYNTLTIPILDPACMPWVKYRMKNGGRIVIGNRGASELLATDANVTVNTLIYGRLRNTIALTAPRTYRLMQGLAQTGDSFTITNAGTGTLIIVDDASGATLGSVGGGQEAIAYNNGTGWE